MSGLSSIDRDVFQHQLTGIASEMSQALCKASHSPIIWDMYDYACAIFSVGGELLAQAETIAAQLGTMSTALAAMKKAIPLEEWRPGDVMVCNDPYQGCTHTPDITVFSPVFHDGRLIAITSTIAHHTDIGGRFPLTTAVDTTETFGEGLIFPPVRLVDEGVENATVFAFIRANVRDPRACIGDLRAQISGCYTAVKRLVELAAAHGNDGFLQRCDELLNYGENYARGVIQAWPDGRYAAEIELEDGIASPENIRVRAAVTVSGGRITIDFDGSSPQVACALNCPWSSTVSLATYAVKCLTAPDIPHNEGFNRVIGITAPEGSIVNPRRPAAVGIRVFVQQAVADVVLKAIGGLVPNYAAAASQISFPTFRASGVDDRYPDGRTFRIMDIIGGGMGAFDGGDGLDAVDTHGANCAILSAEVMEIMSPVRVLSSRLVPGSGGKGRFRGGLAIQRDYEILAQTAIGGCTLQQSTPSTGTWGLAGGEPGGLAGATFNPGRSDEQKLPSRSKHRELRRGDVFRLRSAGGGGFGPAGEREPALNAADLAEGYAP